MGTTIDIMMRQHVFFRMVTHNFTYCFGKDGEDWCCFMFKYWIVAEIVRSEGGLEVLSGKYPIIINNGVNAE